MRRDAALAGRRRRPRSTPPCRRSRDRVRTARPTSAPPSSRARRASARGRRRRSSVASGVVGAGPSARTRGRSPPGPRRRSIRRSAARRRRRAGREAAAGADLDDRQPPAELAEARPDGLAPGRLTGRPDVAAERLEDAAAAASTSASADGRLARDRRDPDVDRLDPGVGRDHRVRRPEHRLAEQLGDLRLADPGQPVGPARPPSLPGRAPGGGGGPRRSTSAASRAAGRAGPRRPGRRAGRRTSPARCRSGWGAPRPTGSARPA